MSWKQERQWFSQAYLPFSIDSSSKHLRSQTTDYSVDVESLAFADDLKI
jgi:hypothetical protein